MCVFYTSDPSLPNGTVVEPGATRTLWSHCYQSHPRCFTTGPLLTRICMQIVAVLDAHGKTHSIFLIFCTHIIYIYNLIFHWYWEFFLVEFCKVYSLAKNWGRSVVTNTCVLYLDVLYSVMTVSCFFCLCSHLIDLHYKYL